MSDSGASSPCPTHANFNDLPYEIHKMIFDVVLDDVLRYKWSWRRRDWKDAKDQLLALTLLNRTWRGIVQEFLFADLFVQGSIIGVDRFQGFCMDNPLLMSHVKCLCIRGAAGNTFLDASEVSFGDDIGRPAFRKEELESNVVRNYTADERGEIFYRVWNDLRDLFAGSELNSDGDLTLIVKAKNPKALCDPRRQFEFVPRDGDSVKELLSIPEIVELKLSTKVSGHLDLHPRHVRIIILSLPDLMYLSLRVSYIRPLRRFRRDIQRGLTETIQWMLQPSVAQNLQSLTLWCKGSFGIHQDRDADSTVFSHLPSISGVGPAVKLEDPFCAALRVLSKSLVYFNYEGRISSELFLPGESEDGVSTISTTLFDEPTTWPLLREYSVHFDAVDSFGRFLYDFDGWERGRNNWGNCGCTGFDGEVEDYPRENWRTDTAQLRPQEIHSEDV